MISRRRTPRPIRSPAMATEEELKKALKAFKKRMKLTQLDDDSKLGHSPLTGVQVQGHLHPAARGFREGDLGGAGRKGYLKRDGIGFYELVPGK